MRIYEKAKHNNQKNSKKNKKKKKEKKKWKNELENWKIGDKIVKKSHHEGQSEIYLKEERREKRKIKSV